MHKRQLLRIAVGLFFVGSLFLAEVSHARDLHGRLGVGFNGQFANRNKTNGVPGVSFKYGLTRDIGLGLIAGITTASPSNSAFGAKFFKNVFFENNLNFYYMAAVALLTVPDTAGTSSTTGFEVQGGLGAEFFIPGLESIGFTFETGVSFNNASGSFALETIGVSLLNAGMHFYF